MVLSQCIVESKPILLKCPHCGSEQSQKNGHRRGKQNYRCKNCGRQFVETYVQRGYSDDTRQICIRMYRSGLTLREIERLTGISHSTIYNWVKQEGLLPNLPKENLTSNNSDSGQ
jgi:transposase-like protein